MQIYDAFFVFILYFFQLFTFIKIYKSSPQFNTATQNLGVFNLGK